MLVLPPSSAATAADVTDDPPTQDTIATLARDFPATNAKLQRIIKK